MSDGNQDQDAIVTRLDALIAAVDRLTDALVASGTVPLAAAPAPVTSAPAEANTVTQSAEVSAVARPPSASPGPSVEVTVDDHVVRNIPGPGASYRATVSRMFQAVLNEDTEVAWREMVALTHSRELVAPRALDGLKAFSWKQLRKNVANYLRGEDTDSFSVVRTDPAELTGTEQRVKVFLAATGRSPAPVTLQRENESGGSWRLGQVSL